MLSEVSFSPAPAVVGAAIVETTGAPPDAVATACAAATGVVVSAAVDSDDDPPRSFGSWIASSATRKSPPAMTKIFCLRPRCVPGSRRRSGRRGSR
jgi:hypothetical protein